MKQKQHPTKYLQISCRIRNYFTARVIRRSGLFDKMWYLSAYSDVKNANIDPAHHYAEFGAKEGRNPSKFFSTANYLLDNLDVAETGINPLYHYERFGRKEKRNLRTDGVNSSERIFYQGDIFTDGEIKQLYCNISLLKNLPLFSVIMPTNNTPELYLRAAIESVRTQIYPHWELCVADDGSTDHTRQILAEYTDEDARIKVVYRENNGGISAATKSAIEIAIGDYLVMLDHDDELTKHALYHLAAAINDQPDADLLYSDEDKIDSNGRQGNPFYKPDWSPHLAISQAYFGHLVCYNASLIKRMSDEILADSVTGAQDYDLWLRVASRARYIRHIPEILYHWRMHSNSTSQNAAAKPYAHNAGIVAVSNYLSSRYPGQRITIKDGSNRFTYQATFDLPQNLLVSIIIPTRNGVDLLRSCIESILKYSSWNNYEIIIINNGSTDRETLRYLLKLPKINNKIRVLDLDIPFNWSRINNIAAEIASGQVLVFLNNDTIVISEDWLEKLAGYATLPDVGVVGALLLFEDGTIQHSGVVVGLGGWADHVYRGNVAEHFIGPFVSPVLTRNVLAVTGACLVIEKDKFYRHGKFDENFVICGSDVELGIRLHTSGLFNVLCAEARLYHLESKTRDPNNIPETDFIQSNIKYEPFRTDKIDPFYNPNLSLSAPNPSPAQHADQRDRRSAAYMLTRSGQNNISEVESAEQLPDTEIPEALPIACRGSNFNRIRLNLLLPALSLKHVFGGVSTALELFVELAASFDNVRIILTDESEFSASNNPNFSDWRICSLDEDDCDGKVIIPVGDRYLKTLSVSAQDRFIATAWWTAISAFSIQEWQMRHYSLGSYAKFVYFIQDFEPGFYSWSSRYALAESTYKQSENVVAIFNSSILKEYFDTEGYSFPYCYSLEPRLHDLLRLARKALASVKKQNIILIYGRPNVDRNLFQIIVMSLRLWVSCHPEIDYTFFSAGESFDPICLGHGKFLRSLGKLSLDEYANQLAISSIGISLMLSPHPSYPPLEMAAFDMRVITNGYKTKNLSAVNESITSISSISPQKIASVLDSLAFQVSKDTSSSIINNTLWKEYLEGCWPTKEVTSYILGLLYEESLSLTSDGEQLQSIGSDQC